MVQLEDIVTLFNSSSREENDATNKIREGVLQICLAPPLSFLEDPVHGAAWRKVSEGWKAILHLVAMGEPYEAIVTHPKGGRRFNYDMIIEYSPTLSIKAEFKYGATCIDKLPQFLSLQAKFPLFTVTYDAFFYDHYLASYVSIDPGITEPIPSRDVYLSLVTNVSDASPFFNMLKEREEIDKKQKAAVVNASITNYLRQYASSIDLDMLSTKLKESQANKVYILCKDGSFYKEEMMLADMNTLTYEGVKNGNAIQIRGGNTMFNLLLRWRNHKGILNPAWQISTTRYVQYV
jgi:hypothetical protein